MFTKVTKQQTLTSGSSGIIQCSAQGTPTPQFDNWRRQDGKPLPKERFRQLSYGRLRVYAVQPEDEGRYICTIKQNNGAERITTKSQVIDVNVIGE